MVSSTIDLKVFADRGNMAATVYESVRAPLSRASRPELPDQGDEESLQFAEREMIGHLIELGIDPLLARRTLQRMTRGDVRITLQTLLDLTPTRLG